VSFTIGMGPSLVEDLMNKKSGDVRLYGGCIKSRKACQMLKIWHEKRWFCLKDTYIIYMDPKLNFSISSVILVDSKFECQMKIKAGAYHAIEVLINSSKSILGVVIKCTPVIFEFNINI
jgi:hypothetical protein